LFFSLAIIFSISVANDNPPVSSCAQNTSWQFFFSVQSENWSSENSPENNMLKSLYILLFSGRIRPYFYVRWIGDSNGCDEFGIAG